jgi:septal ring factor EnvC (AmiA/AmiB activator)
LKRIRDAVTVLPKPTVQSIVDREAGSQIPDSQEMAPPPQSTVGSKWTRLTATSMLSVLQRQLEDQKRESENQKRESKEELERQRLEYNQRVEQMNSQLNALIRQMQASEQQIRKLTDTISILAPHSQEARNK